MKWTGIWAIGSMASVAHVVELASRFGRAIILSHLLSPAEFGIGVAFTAVLGIAELVTDMGLDKFMMSRPQADDHEVLASAHKLALARGVLLAAILAFAAPLIAQIFGVPDQVWSFAIIAAIPLLRAFSHQDLKLVQREFRYAPEATAFSLAHLTVLAVVFPAAHWFGDHRAVLFVLFVECLVYVAASHLLARTRFSTVTKDRRILRDAIAYGLPLTVNGMGIAMMGQADRVLVGNWFGLETLAFYAVVLNLTVTPISAIYRIFGTLAMSFLSRARRDPEKLARFSLMLIWAYAIAAAGYAIFFAAAMETLVPLLFGRVYAVPPVIATIVSMMVWLRVSRGAPIHLTLFHGTTGRLMFAHLMSGIGLVLAVLGLHVSPPLGTLRLCIVVRAVRSLVDCSSIIR